MQKALSCQHNQRCFGGAASENLAAHDSMPVSHSYVLPLTIDSIASGWILTGIKGQVQLKTCGGSICIVRFLPGRADLSWQRGTCTGQLLSLTAAAFLAM